VIRTLSPARQESSPSNIGPWRGSTIRANRVLQEGGVVRFVADYCRNVQSTSGHQIAFVSSLAGDRDRKTNFVYRHENSALLCATAS
jgi:hypothetical protein